MNKYIRALAVFGTSFLDQVSGGEFINLGFDEPHLENLQVDPGLQVAYGNPTDLVPGWVISQNNIQINRVWYYNGGSVSPVTLRDSGTLNGGYIVSYSGYSVGPFGLELKSTQFTQSGTIPEWAVTLEFFWGGRTSEFDTPLRVNGEVLPVQFNPSSPFRYSADVSRWAGQEVLLSLNFPSGSASDIDGLRFTVPEPSLLGLALFGSVGLYWAFRKTLAEDQQPLSVTPRSGSLR